MKKFFERWLGRSAPLAPARSPTPNQDRVELLLAEGHRLEKAGQWVEAEARYQEALRLDSDNGSAHACLGKLCLSQRRHAEAIDHYHAAAQVLPDAVECVMGLGNALESLGRYPDALDAYYQALAIQPDCAEAQLSAGRALILIKQYEEAVECLEEALAAMPDSGLVHAMLGQAMSNLGLMQEAVAYERRALELGAPNKAFLAHILTFHLNYLPDLTPEQLFAAHLDYARRYCAPFYPKNRQYPNVPDPERRLKIGYVSGDFREHAVACFLETVFTHRDRSQFETHAFYNYDLSDEVTERLKQQVDYWRPIAMMDDNQVAELISHLGIDILVDLSGHTQFQRLQVFARKPAPVQATWLGYAGTTGLQTMGYRICDAYSDPPGLVEPFHTEQLIRMPDSQWCHIPYVNPPPISELPLRRNGYLTLGSFNNPAKLNDQVLALWADLLRAVPGCRLRIAHATANHTQKRLISVLGQAGIAPECLEFPGYQPSYQHYLSAIADVDIALDPFPYNGCTTSVDTLMMGVPLVTLAGERSMARVGVSLLSSVGLPELIASSPEEYVTIIQGLASDPDRLAALRHGLRERVQQSPLLDGARFTRNLETLYRQMWRTWCEQQLPD